MNGIDKEIILHLNEVMPATAKKILNSLNSAITANEIADDIEINVEMDSIKTLIL
jgi:hypothetical protein